MDSIDVKGSLQNINHAIIQLLEQSEKLYADVGTILDYQQNKESKLLSNDQEMDVILPSDYIRGIKGSLLSLTSCLVQIKKGIKGAVELL